MVQVVIVVKGVRNRVHNQTSAAVPTVVKTVDRVANATTSSKTAASIQDLRECCCLILCFKECSKNTEKDISCSAYHKAGDIDCEKYFFKKIFFP